MLKTISHQPLSINTSINFVYARQLRLIKRQGVGNYRIDHVKLNLKTFSTFLENLYLY